MNEIRAHYETGAEKRRLAAWARFEFIRNIEVFHRYLPPPIATVGDIGGGPGTYAVPLAMDGYIVHLVDPVGSHVDEARAAAALGDSGLASSSVGDARELQWSDSSIDAAILFGPLYHLTSPQDRAQALAEARRVLRPDGTLFAMAISRFASLFDGLVRRFLVEPDFRSVVRRDLASGQHRNPKRDPRWFTTAYFHRPEEFQAEIEEAGFDVKALLAVEGPAGHLGDLLAWWLEDEERQQLLLSAIREVESEPSLLSASPQILAVARVSGR